MHLNLFMAKRYLFSKKRQNAVNIISIIAIIGMAIGTAALIVVMSVFNGIDSLIKESESSLTPAISIYPAQGKFTEQDSTLVKKISEIDGVLHVHSVIEESAVAKFKNRIQPITLKGVTEEYIEKTQLEDKIVGGGIRLTSTEGRPCIIAGYGVASNMELEFRKNTPILLYYPNKNSSSTSINALSTIECELAGVFSFNQEQDERVVFADIKSVSRLLKAENQETKIEVFASDSDIEPIKSRIIETVPNNRIVVDKFQERKAFYAMMQGEKMAIFFIMLFIILIASFNIVASISMLILDKRSDATAFYAIGFTEKSIKRIFNLQGIGIVAIGIIAGTIAGSALCLVQEHYGIVTLGDGNYVTNAYPVDFYASDLLLILISVISIGALATTIPANFLIKKLFKQQ